MAKKEFSEQQNDDLGISLEMIDDETLELDSTFDELGEEGVENTPEQSNENVENNEDNNNPDADDNFDVDINAEFAKMEEDNKKILNDNDEKNTSEGLSSTEKKSKDESESDDNGTNKDDANKDADSGSLTIAFAKTLSEMDSLSDFNEEDYQKTVEEKGEAAAFVELLQNEVEKRTESYKENIDKYSQEYMKLKETGMSSDEAGSLVANKEIIDNIKEESLVEDESLQEDVVAEVLRLRNFTDEEIKDEIQNLKDLDKLSDRSKKSLPLLQNYYDRAIKVQQQNHQKLIEKQEEDKNKYISTVKENVNNLDEILKDKKINKQTKDKIINSILLPVGEDKQGRALNSIWKKRSENPIDFDIKLAYFMNMGLFDGKTDTLIKDGKTKALKDLENKLKGGKFSTGSPNYTDVDNSLEGNIEAMEEFLDE